MARAADIRAAQDHQGRQISLFSLNKWVSTHAPRWDALHGLGDIPAMRVTILVPLLGYLILFNAALIKNLELAERLVPPDSLLAIFATLRSHQGATTDSLITQIGDMRLYLLYFGGTLLGLGQLLFVLRCPKLVRRYRSAHAFVAAEGPIMNLHRVESMIMVIGGRIARDVASVFNIDPSVIAIRREISDQVQPLQITSLRLAFSVDTKRTPINNADEITNALNGFAGAIFHNNWTAQEIMAHWFVPLKSERPWARLGTTILYSGGFFFLIIPALDTFLSVLMTVM